ncbi:MAG: fasciclin domain-containing protein [Pirellulales bacterium]
MSNRQLRLPLLALTAFSLLSGGVRAAENDIVETAVEAGSFKTLTAALQAADLVSVLQSEGPFTVFAPTDEAFAKLPEGTVETLLKPENKDQLVAVLTYHVVAGRIPAKEVVGLKAAKTVNGQRVDVAAEDGSVLVDKSHVVATDIGCSNGVIHVIDSVLLPSQDDIPATAAKAGTFKTLLTAAEAAGLVDTLAGEGPLTVFAPTDDAFAKLPDGTVASLLRPENRDKLAAILKYHVLPGRVYSDEALKAGSAKTVEGGQIAITVAGDQAKINDANLVALDIDAANGVIHVIDAVLLPGQGKVSATDGRSTIEHAVARGAKLYNHGHHAECAKIYMQTAHELISQGERMPPSVMTSLKSALDEAEQCHCPTQRSWTMRRGLDSAYYAMKDVE